MANLIFKGHATRGKELHKLLEHLGGVDAGYSTCSCVTCFYYINREGYIEGSSFIPDYMNHRMIMSLETFESQFPYKVGDKIPDVWGDSLTVKSMSWDENYKTVMYGFEESVFIVRADEMEAENENKPLFKPGDVVKLKGCPDKNLFWIVMDVVKDGYIFSGWYKDASFNSYFDIEDISIVAVKEKNGEYELIETIAPEGYNKLVENIENGTVFAKREKTIWICLNCGHIHVGEEAPELCPACAHPKAHFERKVENY